MAQLALLPDRVASYYSPPQSLLRPAIRHGSFAVRQLINSIASMIRALIMLAILGGGAYLACEHTPILEIAREKFSEWQNRQSEPEWGGGEAPSFQAGGNSPLQPITGDAQPWAPVNPRAAAEDQSPSSQYPGRQVGYVEANTLGADTSGAANSSGGDSEYLSIERRLRQMGVVYSMLESNGRDGGRFRFLCRVALPGSSTKYQKFEATGSDPVEAMRQVIGKVEQWRSYNDSLRR